MPLKGPSKLVISSQSRSFTSPNSHQSVVCIHSNTKNVSSSASDMFYESSVNIENRSKRIITCCYFK